MPIYILGTGLSHNGSAVLLKDGQILVAIEKERITRKKHDGGNDFDAVKYCLDAAGIGLNDLSLVVQCANFEKDSIGIHTYKGKRFFPEDFAVPVVTISHHLAHAYSASGRAPFDHGYVFVLDGCGSPIEQCDDLFGTKNLAQKDIEQRQQFMYCEKDSYYRMKDGLLTPLVKDFSELGISAPPLPLSPDTTSHSIGGFYGAASRYCFGNMDDAGKLMGLAPYGKPGVINLSAFRFHKGRVFVNMDVLPAFNRPASNFNDLKDNFQYYADFAHWVQSEVEEAVLYTLRHRIRQYKTTSLCYTGGVALNALTNSRIKRELGLKQLHIEPAAGDNGLALGCAFYGWLHVLGKPKQQHANRNSFGYSYPQDHTGKMLAQQTGIITKQSKDVVADTARLLEQGKVVAWFHEGAEFGPRALGFRSILANPFTPGIREYINAEIKLREDFRPFAPSVLAEDVTKYYKYNEESPFMLLVNTIKPEFEALLDAVVHKNKTSRVQTVTEKDNPQFYHLLKAFKRITGHGILLNTSFNKRGMPIVETPADAISFFRNSKLDYLIIGNTIVSKKQNDTVSVEKITTFLNEIGIETRFEKIERETFLPGILIDKGKLIIDEEKLLYPGDLLHEAGHIAVMKPEDRVANSGNIGEQKSKNDADGEELMAIAWSYAALHYLNLDPQVVFHPAGYKGAAEWYIEQYTSGNFIALPVLQWIGLCYDPKNARIHGVLPYPNMIKWLRS
jgi:carbamoyltransferase